MRPGTKELDGQIIDMRNEIERLIIALREAADALDSAGFTFSADKAWAAASVSSGFPPVKKGNISHDTRV